MTEFKSSYEIIREKLEKENRIKKLSPEVVFQLVNSLNEEAEADEASLNRKMVESAKELADIVLNA